MTRVLYVGSGFCPFRGMAADLPKHLAGAGVDIDLIVPHLANIDEGEGRLAERLVDLHAYIDGAKRQMRLLEGRRDGHIRTFYVDEDAIRVPCLSLNNEDGIRATAIFAHAVVQWIAKSPNNYDIIQCEGIEAALVAPLIKTTYSDERKLATPKIVTILPGIEDKASIDMSWIDRIGLPGQMASSNFMEFYGKLSILKGAYLYADAIVFPCDCIKRRIEKNRGKDIGMEGVLFDKTDKLYSIHCGINIKSIHPSTNKNIAANFSQDDLSGKITCKNDLIKELGLKKNRPVLSFIGHLDSESGIDLINDILDDLMDRNVNLVIAGHGSDKYLNAILSWKDEFHGSIAVLPGKPSIQLRHKLLSASDILLMPAKHESLSRVHLCAMTFATVVVARKQGCIGRDIHSVRDIQHISDEDNGFTFSKYDSDEFFDAVMDALDVYDSPSFADLRAHAAAVSVPINTTAKDCIEIYNSLLK